MCSRSPLAAPRRRQATNDDDNSSGGGGVSSSFFGGHLTASAPDMLRNGQLSSRPRTDVWRYFVYSEKKDRTRCAVDFCGTVLPGQDAAHLRRHLQLKHPAIYKMLPSDAVRTSRRKTPDLPSVPLPGNITHTLRKNFKKKLNSIMDSLLKSTVSEITNAFDAVTFDHQMVVKQKIEEISLLRLKLEKAEKKLLEQNGKWDQKEVVTHTSGQILPEITVDVPDDWCAPLGCENVVEQTPSTSYAAREDGSSSLCSLSVSLWRLPDIKQEVQDDGYQLDSYLSGQFADEDPQCNFEHTKDPKKPSSAPKHRRPTSVRPTQNRKESTNPKPEQPIDAPMTSNERLPRTAKVNMEVTHIEKGKEKKKNIPGIKSEPEQMEETSGDNSYQCKFCSKVFDTEFGRSVHTRSHRKCPGCYKMFKFPSYLRAHTKTCVKLRKTNSSNVDKLLSLREREKPSLGEDEAILPIRMQHSTRKPKFKKHKSVFPSKKTPYVPKRDKPFPCMVCHKKFCSLVWLQNHTAKHLACTKCPKLFCAKYDLSRHIYKVHTQNQKVKSEPLAGISSKEKQSEFGAISSSEKQSELGAVSSKEKPRSVDD